MTGLTRIGAGPQDQVFGWLDFNSLFACAATCREWRAIEARPQGVWRAIVMRMLPPGPGVTVTNYKQWFRERFAGKIYVERRVPTPPSADLRTWVILPHHTVSGNKLTCTSGQYGEICVFDIDWKKLKFSKPEFFNVQGALCACASGDTIAVSGRYPFRVSLYELKVEKLKKELECPHNTEKCKEPEHLHSSLLMGEPCGTIEQLAFNGQLVATLSACNGDIKIWDVETNALVSTIANQPSRRIQKFWFSGDCLTINTMDGSTLWNARTGTRLPKLAIVCSKSVDYIDRMTNEVVFRDYTAFVAPPPVPAPSAPTVPPTRSLASTLLSWVWPF